MLFQVFILSLLLGLIIGCLVGGFIEWDSATTAIRQLKSDLRIAHKENDELFEHIYALRNPSARG